MKRKIAVFTGTRAEYGLLYWLIKALDSDSNIDLSLIVSGSHLSPEFGQTYKVIEADGFDIADKVEMLLSSDTTSGVVKSMGLGMIGLADSYARLDPEAIVLVGDRFEALAAAQTAMLMGIPVIHIHGGEITEGAYDNSIRHAITKLSSLHFTSTDEYRDRVIQMGEQPDKVFNVGALGLEHLHRTQLHSRSELARSIGFDLSSPYFLVSYHPETLGSINSMDSFNSILESLESFKDFKVLISYPNADNGGRELIAKISVWAESQPGRVFVTKSFGQLNYLSALKHAHAVIGNSSSGIIEAPSLGVPTINVGARQKGRLSAASIIHSGPDSSSLKRAMRLALSKEFSASSHRFDNPYDNGLPSRKIMHVLQEVSLSQEKVFFDIERSKFAGE